MSLTNDNLKNVSEEQVKRRKRIDKTVNHHFKKYDEVFQALAKEETNLSKNLHIIFEEDKNCLKNSQSN